MKVVEIKQADNLIKFCVRSCLFPTCDCQGDKDFPERNEMKNKQREGWNICLKGVKAVKMA